MRITTLLLALAVVLFTQPLFAQTPIENPKDVFCETVSSAFAHYMDPRMADDIQIVGAHEWEQENQRYASVQVMLIKTCNLMDLDDKEFERKVENTSGCWDDNEFFNSRVYVDREERTLTTAVTIIVPAKAIGDRWNMQGIYCEVGNDEALQKASDEMAAAIRTRNK